LGSKLQRKSPDFWETHQLAVAEVARLPVSAGSLATSATAQISRIQSPICVRELSL
jgi:hypothetical protein